MEFDLFLIFCRVSSCLESPVVTTCSKIYRIIENLSPENHRISIHRRREDYIPQNHKKFVQKIIVFVFVCFFFTEYNSIPNKLKLLLSFWYA